MLKIGKVGDGREKGGDRWAVLDTLGASVTAKKAILN